MTDEKLARFTFHDNSFTTFENVFKFIELFSTELGWPICAFLSGFSRRFLQEQEMTTTNDDDKNRIKDAV